jgi:hypothetical protein
VVLVLLALLGALLAVALVTLGDRAPVGPGPGAGAVAGQQPHGASGARVRSAERRALGVLRAWDGRRAAAYRAGSAGRLLSLYTTGSVAGAADARLLRRYRDRGLRVVGMRTQVLAVRVLRSDRGHLRLRVSDRLVGAVAVRGRQRQPLPRDAASGRVVGLVRAGDGRWRVASVTDDP